jgi:hypothetical protein
MEKRITEWTTCKGNKISVTTQVNYELDNQGNRRTHSWTRTIEQAVITDGQRESGWIIRLDVPRGVCVAYISGTSYGISADNMARIDADYATCAASADYQEYLRRSAIVDKQGAEYRAGYSRITNAMTLNGTTY